MCHQYVKGRSITSKIRGKKMSDVKDMLWNRWVLNHCVDQETIGAREPSPANATLTDASHCPASGFSFVCQRVDMQQAAAWAFLVLVIHKEWQSNCNSEVTCVLKWREWTKGSETNNLHYTTDLLRMTEDRDKWSKYVHGVTNPRIEDGWGTEQNTTTVMNGKVKRPLQGPFPFNVCLLYTSDAADE